MNDAAQDLDQGGFAGTVFADEAMHFPRAQVETDPIQGDDTPETLAHVAHAEQSIGLSVT